MNYSFKCECDPPKRAFFSPLIPIRRRPKCRRCDGIWTACDSQWDTPDALIADILITPAVARKMLKNAISVEGPTDPKTVAQYSDLMRTGKWRNLTLEMGGIHCPIVVDRDGHTRYGLQRLEACILAGTPFEAVVVQQGVHKEEDDPSPV